MKRAHINYNKEEEDHHKQNNVSNKHNKDRCKRENKEDHYKTKYMKLKSQHEIQRG
jgi:hypothetical protein